MEVEVNNVTIETIQGDITQQEDMDAIVNAANAELQPGGGVCGVPPQAPRASAAKR